MTTAQTIPFPTTTSSTAGYECEYYAGHGYYCDPADADSIRAAVQTAWDRYAIDAEARKRLRSLILRDYTWQRAAEQSLAGYRAALAATSRFESQKR